MDALHFENDADARRPALPGFIERKRIATGDITGRRVVIEACKAELDWSKADRRRLAVSGIYVLQDTNAEAFDFPHELAAAVVLNVWGHLHPIETRIVACWSRMHAQRSAGWSDAGRAAWAAAARGSAADLRWYIAERRKLKPIFNRAVTAYRAERALVDAELANNCN